MSLYVDDVELIYRAQRGDNESINSLAKRYEPRLRENVFRTMMQSSLNKWKWFRLLKN